MLLTLNATCVRALLVPGARGKRAALELQDLPAYTHETLGLAGLNLSTDLLAGADRRVLESLRERGDKASCAALLLIESEAQPFGAADEAAAKAAVARMGRVIEAAQILGCSSAAVKIIADNTEAGMTRAAERLRPIVERAERLDVNLLIAPTKGLTEAADRVTEFIKRVGGFRIGTFPDFEAASKTKDPVSYLRRLTPYASVVCASTLAFKVGKADGKRGAAKGKSLDLPAEARGDAAADPLGIGLADDAKHEAYDLMAYVGAVASVGYDGALAIDYRGPGDAAAGVVYSRNALQQALDDDEEPIDLDADLLEDLEPGEDDEDEAVEGDDEAPGPKPKA